MSTERDELAEIVESVSIIRDKGEQRNWETRIADAILAAGYRKPRTITTVEELDTLPYEAVVRDAGGYVLEHWEEPEDRIWKASGNEWGWSTDDIGLPATVLYTPEPLP